MYYYYLNLDKQRDFEMQKTAWLAALLMNASGNYKRKISPSSLYKSPYIKEMQEEHMEENKIDEIEKKQKIADVKAKFGK